MNRPQGLARTGLLVVLLAALATGQDFEALGTLGTQTVAPVAGNGGFEAMHRAFAGEFTGDDFDDVLLHAGDELRLLTNPGIWGSVRTLQTGVRLVGKIPTPTSTDAFFVGDANGLHVWQPAAIPGEFDSWAVAPLAFDAEVLAFGVDNSGPSPVALCAAWFHNGGALALLSLELPLTPGAQFTWEQFAFQDHGQVHDLLVQDLDGDQSPEVIMSTDSGAHVYNSSLQLVSEYLRSSTSGRLVPVQTQPFEPTRVAWLRADAVETVLSVFGQSTLHSEESSLASFAGGLAVGRVHGDSLDDLFLSRAGGVTVLLQDCGAQQFSLTSKPCMGWISDGGVFSAGSSLAGPVVADLDRDGDDDLIAFRDDLGKVIVHTQADPPSAQSTQAHSLRWLLGSPTQLRFEVEVGAAAEAHGLVWAWSDLEPPRLKNVVVGHTESSVVNGMTLLRIDLDPALETTYLGLEIRLRASDGSPMRGSVFGLARSEAGYALLEQLVPPNFANNGIPPQPNQGGELVGGVLPLPRLPPFEDGETPLLPAGWD